jgi:hypothetical protein
MRGITGAGASGTNPVGDAIGGEGIVVVADIGSQTAILPEALFGSPPNPAITSLVRPHPALVQTEIAEQAIMG